MIKTSTSAYPIDLPTKIKYVDLYIYNDQALYDAESTWNKQAWEVDQLAGKLIAEGKTKNLL
ncbi:hypothetical protein [Flavobacterium taihuense]|uniref:Uncharacterized protein n=1 Tax=Flavobacterium taihuense TaxID=2857508 RepID=A0ABS6XVZ7_9FLAO|nr:hypothetical protein [Flavobacterium taihuense]MBW4360822.1 hypothetical protein [Flavobacterium taihuense]